MCTHPSLYLRVWLILVLSLLALVGTFDLVIDPYYIFDSPRWEGINAKKPAAANRSATIKPYAVASRKPEVLIVGNSRPEMGLDPEHPCIRILGEAYSLTFPGASLYRQARYLQHALAYSKPRLVLLGLDFLDFLEPPGDRGNPYQWPPYNSSGAFERRLAVDAHGKPNSAQVLERILDYRDAIFSLTALSDSIKTIIAQGYSLASTRTPEGFNPAQEYHSIIASEGQHVLFEQKVQEVRSRLIGTSWTIFSEGSTWSPEFTVLEKMITQLKHDGVELIVFINPYHKEYLRIIKETGYQRAFELWKQQLLELVQNKYGVPLYDFAKVNEWTSELPPPPGDTRTTLQWFWEPAHYRKSLGDQMLRVMLSELGCSPEN